MRSRLFLCLCALVLPSLARAGQILTPVTSWPLTHTHSGLAIAPNGNVYASDEDGVVDYFSPQGTLLGSWPARSTAAIYNGPQGIAIDHRGFVYVVYGNGGVEKFTSDGAHVLAFTDPLCDKGRGIAVDHAGNIYVGSYGVIGSIAKFDQTGQFIREFPSRQAHAVEVDGFGNVYAAGRDLIEKFSPRGDLLQQQAGEGSCPQVYSFDLVSDGEGFVLAANNMYSNVLVLSADLDCQASWTMPPPPDGVIQQTLPTHLAFDPSGNLYVQDVMYDRVVKYRLDTSVPTLPLSWGQLKSRYR